MLPGLAVVFLDVDIYLFGEYKLLCLPREKNGWGRGADAESGLLACVTNNYLLIKSTKIARTVIADA